MESVLDISAHKYGNYHKYYTFHPSETRSSFFSKRNIFFQMWEAQGRPGVFSLLDIGCNEGNLSMDVLKEAQLQLPREVKCILLGIDIDSSLIDLANAKYSNEYDTRSIEFKTVNFMDKTESDLFFKEYFAKQSVALDHEFSGFSIVSLFSITMWIHLNHGDEGFLSFLERSAALLHSSGSLIVEPQPWKCYKNADKRCRKLGITRPLHYSELFIREIEVETVRIVMGTVAMIESSGTEARIDASHNTISDIICEVTIQGEREVDDVHDQTNMGKEREDEEPKHTKEAGQERRDKSKEERKKKQKAREQERSPKLPSFRNISANMKMRSYWDLGKEGWGRSILIFHRSAQLSTSVFHGTKKEEEKEKEKDESPMAVSTEATAEERIVVDNVEHGVVIGVEIEAGRECGDEAASESDQKKKIRVC